jgi:hypothetical protein
MKSETWIAIATILLAIGCRASLAQEKSYTRADFIAVDGGPLNDRFDRALKQFKASNQGDACWIAYHFPASEGSFVGPFGGMIYYDDGIRLERKPNPAEAAVFLLTDAAGTVTRIKTLDLSERYVFEKRPVYWLGNGDATQSLVLLEAKMRGGKENRELASGALRAIAAHDAPRVVPLLKEIASKETVISVQVAAVSSLARVKTDQGVDALIDLYDSLSVDSLKEEVIRGLARTDHRKAADKLLAIAKNDSNPKLRQQAVRRLSQSRGGS